MSSLEWLPVIIFLALVIKLLTEGIFKDIFTEYFKAKEKYEKRKGIWYEKDKD